MLGVARGGPGVLLGPLAPAASAGEWEATSGRPCSLLPLTISWQKGAGEEEEAGTVHIC